MSRYYIRIVHNLHLWPNYAFKSRGLEPLRDPALKYHDDVCLDGKSDFEWMRELAFRQEELPLAIDEIRRSLNQTIERWCRVPRYMLQIEPWREGMLVGQRGRRIRVLPLHDASQQPLSGEHVAFAWISQRPDMLSTYDNPIFARVALTKPRDTYYVGFVCPAYNGYYDVKMRVTSHRPWDSLLEFPWYEPAYRPLHENNSRHAAAVSLLYEHEAAAFMASTRLRPMITELSVTPAQPDDVLERYPYTRWSVRRRAIIPDEKWWSDVGFRFALEVDYERACNTPTYVVWKAALAHHAGEHHVEQR